MKKIPNYFVWSYIALALGLVLSVMWGGWDALFYTVLLIILEISFSFDNAVVNATVLKHMDHKWQQRFLTWGILIAVFGMYYLFPIVIVAVATGINPVEVTQMALEAPDTYREHLEGAHIQIAAFGGMFLLMVFLKFFFNEHKDVHWLSAIEKKFSQLGKLESVEIMLALILLLTIAHYLPTDDQHVALISGLVGVVVYVMMGSITGLLSSSKGESTNVLRYSGMMGFIYLQLLDASFSLDAVVGAFAISHDIVIIVIGLTVGALFVRSLTVHLVRAGTLDQYIFLEHGAHWGIGALAVIMLCTMMMHIPEYVTGLVGVAFIVFSFWSSVKQQRKITPN